jgi:hypothetical protein
MFENPVLGKTRAEKEYCIDIIKYRAGEVKMPCKYSKYTCRRYHDVDNIVKCKGVKHVLKLPGQASSNVYCIADGSSIKVVI